MISERRNLYQLHWPMAAHQMPILTHPYWAGINAQHGIVLLIIGFGKTR